MAPLWWNVQKGQSLVNGIGWNRYCKMNVQCMCVSVTYIVESRTKPIRFKFLENKCNWIKRKPKCTLHSHVYSNIRALLYIGLSIHIQMKVFQLYVPACVPFVCFHSFQFIFRFLILCVSSTYSSVLYSFFMSIAHVILIVYDCVIKTQSYTIQFQLWFVYSLHHCTVLHQTQLNIRLECPCTLLSAGGESIHASVENGITGRECNEQKKDQYAPW